MAVRSQTCKAKVKGRPCRSPRLKGDEYCYFHSEKMVEKRRRAQKRGAQATNLIRQHDLAAEIPSALRTIGDLMTTIEVFIREVAMDRMDPRRATALLGLVRLQAQLVVDHDLEERIAKLEEAA